MTVTILAISHLLVFLLGAACAYSILKKDSPIVEQVTKLETKIETGIKDTTEKIKEAETEIVKMSAEAKSTFEQEKTKAEQKKKKSKVSSSK